MIYFEVFSTGSSYLQKESAAVHQKVVDSTVSDKITAPAPPTLLACFY